MTTQRKPQSEKPRRVLVLGSGALQIGQAGEFDYSGTQALKALREEGIDTVLINPNIATIQTDRDIADRVYFLPVTPYFVEKVIAAENIDALLLGFGGQTALNCGVELEDSGVLARYGVTVLGTPVSVIKDTEDRDRFVQRLHEIDVKTPRSRAVTSVADALQAAREIGFPVMLRSAFALGGKGSDIVQDEEACMRTAEVALANAPQILVEECLYGWKELEYEVVRDGADNCITVCNMENVDPMGIHTGESIVVAPSQTLNDHEYQLLRTLALKTIRHLGIVGECNIQFALDPMSSDYRVIEVNARLSRSSALASKATGYPLAYVAAKIALGYALPDIPNAVTKVTCALFEPALDYIVCKIPRWDLQKFEGSDQTIGTEMKSVGEVMAIGRSFAEALQKGLRMLEIGVDGLDPHAFYFPDLEEALRTPTPQRMFAIAQAFQAGMCPDTVSALTQIDRFFLQEMCRVVAAGERLESLRGVIGDASRIDDITRDLRQAKRDGFSDRYLARQWGLGEEAVRALRYRLGIHPGLSQIDTLAAEYPAETNFLYLSYGASAPLAAAATERGNRQKVLVLGSGPYRIGSSVEFDWCAVNAVKAARELGYETVMVNCNPETASTDYDMCDHLVFDELTLEAVLEICHTEAVAGVMVSMGGQVANNLAIKLAQAGVRIFGTPAAAIDHAEDREKFSSLLDTLSIPQPRWAQAGSRSEVSAVAHKMGGFPILVRPSYVLSGSAMRVANDPEELSAFLAKAVEVSPEHPVVLSKFETDAREYELDAVADAGEVVLWAMSEHVENAGTHSGDATLICPPQGVPEPIIDRVRDIGQTLARALDITGPFNVQCLATPEGDVKVIECNLRASRSFPFVSKTLGVNFIHDATRRMLGTSPPANQMPDLAALGHVGVKAPQFSFSRIKGVDPRSGVEMASTGEVACFGRDGDEALAKAMLAVGYSIPWRGILVHLPSDRAIVHVASALARFAGEEVAVYAQRDCARRLCEQGLATTAVRTIDAAPGCNPERAEEKTLDLLKSGKVDLVISIPSGWSTGAPSAGFKVRRAAVDLGVPLITDVHVARRFLAALATYPLDALTVQPHGLALDRAPAGQPAHGATHGVRPGPHTESRSAPARLRLFVRQSFTECGPEEAQIVQGVLDLLQELNGRPYALESLTGLHAESQGSFRLAFAQASGRAFTPHNFRCHRFALLDRADAMIVVRTGLSESSAVEIAYNIFKGRQAPIFFAVWRQAPIKTTLLRELDELATVRYLDFDHPRELRGPLLEFFRLLVPSPAPRRPLGCGRH